MPLDSPRPKRARCRLPQHALLLPALVLVLSGLGLPQAQAREGVDVGNNSAFSRLVPAESVERSAAQQYAQMLQQAGSKNALAGKEQAQLRRLRAIAQRIIPFAAAWNPRAKDWRWEVNLIGSAAITSECEMPSRPA